MDKKDNSGKIVFQNLLAAAAGDLKFLQSSWFQGNNLNAGDYDGRTPLHVAAAEGKFEVVEFLVKLAQVNPNPKDRWQKIPLHDAILFNRTKVIWFLNDYRDPTEPDEDKYFHHLFEEAAKDSQGTLISLLSLLTFQVLIKINNLKKLLIDACFFRGGRSSRCKKEITG